PVLTDFVRAERLELFAVDADRLTARRLSCPDPQMGLYCIYYRDFTAVIVSSSRAPRASSFTATVERVGRGCVLEYSRYISLNRAKSLMSPRYAVTDTTSDRSIPAAFSSA